MNMNRLSLIPNEADDKNFARFQPQKNEQQQLTLSDIAARLRSVHEQMKTKAPTRETENVMPFPQNKDDGVKAYLDDIARALLKEYEARKTAQNELVHHFQRFEQLLVENRQGMKTTAASDRQILMKEVAEEVQSRLKQELSEQTKSLAAEGQKANQEISRQLREAVAASRFSVQLVSLQRQITNLQATLDAHDKSLTKGSSEDSVKVEKENFASLLNSTQIPTPTIGQNHKDAQKVFDKSVIRILAEKKTPELTGEINNATTDTDKTGLEDKARIQIPETGNTKSKSCMQKFDAETSGHLICCARAVNKGIKTNLFGKLQNRDKAGRTLTRVSALFLMAVLAYGLSGHFNISDHASVFSFLR